MNIRESDNYAIGYTSTYIQDHKTFKRMIHATGN
jgi:hypothetical protein